MKVSFYIDVSDDLGSIFLTHAILLTTSSAIWLELYSPLMYILVQPMRQIGLGRIV